MRKTARFSLKIIKAVVLITLVALVLPMEARAASGNVQICNPSTSCTVGEFVYDDTYAAENSATCTITSRYPDSSLLFNAQALTHASENDGWYYHTFTAPTTTGLYRTTIQCVVNSETIALDKTFEVQSAASGGGSSPTANEIAEATWSYSGRSLSTFGNLVSDIWSYTTRTITGAGLSSGSIATKADVSTSTSTSDSDIATIKENVRQTRLLVDKIANKPIIETTTEEVPDLSVKLIETEKNVDVLYKGTKDSSNRISQTVLKWNSLSEDEILENVEAVSRKIGGENDKSSSKTIFGSINYLKSSWDWATIKTTDANIKSIRDLSFSLQSDLETRGKSKTTQAKSKLLANLLKNLESSVGDTSSLSSDDSIYSRLNETKKIAKSLDSSAKTVEGILAKWKDNKYSDKQKKVAQVSRKVAEINRIPSVKRSLTTSAATDDKSLKNNAYYVLGIISSNKKLLAKNSGTAMTNTWLELGSIVFKTLATNPSSLISQDVEVKYYLPQELKKEDVLETDEGLELKYDTEKNQYYIIGDYYLAPNETKTISVRTEDIWEINQAQIDTLRTQAEELSKPLKSTSFFAQGVTLKTDIDVSLDKVELLMKNDSTPEQKIRSYREAQIELDAVKEKIDKLKDLATEAGSVGTLFGFVGGVQAIAVWGLILILAVGFVSITIYMKFLMKKEKKPSKKQLNKEMKAEDEKVKEVVRSKNNKKLKLALGVIMITVLFSGIGIGSVTGVVIAKSYMIPAETSKSIAKADFEKKVLGDSVNNSEKEMEVVEEIAEVKEEPKDMIFIKDTPTGYLRVRVKPSGAELARILPGEKFEILEEESGWIKITTPSGEGWILKSYTEPLEASNSEIKNIVN